MDSIAKIVKTYAYRKTDSSLLEAAKEADRTFRHAKPELEVMGEDETVRAHVTETQLFHMWLNGRYFHNDFDGLMMLTPGSTAVTEKLKAVFLFSVVRHLRRLEHYEPIVKFIVLKGDLPRGYLHPGTPVNTQS